MGKNMLALRYASDRVCRNTCAFGYIEYPIAERFAAFT